MGATVAGGAAGLATLSIPATGGAAGGTAAYRAGPSRGGDDGIELEDDDLMGAGMTGTAPPLAKAGGMAKPPRGGGAASAAKKAAAAKSTPVAK